MSGDKGTKQSCVVLLFIRVNKKKKLLRLKKLATFNQGAVSGRVDVCSVCAVNGVEAP